MNAHALARRRPGGVTVAGMRALLVAVAMTLAACSAQPDASAPTEVSTRPEVSAPVDPSPSTSAADGPAALSWRRLPAAPTARTEVAAVAVGDEIVVAGGFDAAGRPIPTVEMYDAAAHRWSPGPELPLPVHHAMAASDGDTAYVIGGYTSAAFSQVSDQAFALRDSMWSSLPRLPEPRAAAGAAVVDGRLYAAGGVGPDGLAEQMLVFDLDERRWRMLPGPPTPREHLGVAAARGRLFVAGGRTGGLDTNLAATEVFDPHLNRAPVNGTLRRRGVRVPPDRAGKPALRARPPMSCGHGDLRLPDGPLDRFPTLRGDGIGGGDRARAFASAIPAGGHQGRFRRLGTPGPGSRRGHAPPRG